VARWFRTHPEERARGVPVESYLSEPGVEAGPISRPIPRMISNSSSRTGWTERRIRFTRTISPRSGCSLTSWSGTRRGKVSS
jgi:hypothetical protein